MPDNLYQAPAAPVAHHNHQDTPPPTFKQKLFSFEGRFSRSQFWGYGMGVSTLISMVMMVPYIAIIIMAVMAEESGTTPNIPIMIILGLLCLAIYIPAVWVSLAGTAKRFHDRGKSGWMAAILFIPFGSLWILIECGILEGTPGPNQYGPDPLGRA